MKTTKELCFSNGTEFMMWQERNCCRCVKAVWYNEKNDLYPKYRCAVQRDIESQAIGMEEINIRSYKAASRKDCQYIVTEIKKKGVRQPNEYPLFDSCDYFASGESLVKKEKEKFNPTIQELESAERRVIDTIWEKEIKPHVQSPADVEQLFKEHMHNEAKSMLQTLTWDDNMMIAFVPLIISQIAWIYAEKVTAYCAKNRIPETVKLSRAVKEMQSRYIDELKLDLDAVHISRIKAQTLQFIDTCGKDFSILWFSVNGEIKRNYPDIRFCEMRTDAFVAILMVRFLKEHNKRMNAMVKNKMPNANDVPTNKYMIALETLMDAYAGDYTIDINKNIELCMKILQNNIHRIEFGVQ